MDAKKKHIHLRVNAEDLARLERVIAAYATITGDQIDGSKAIRDLIAAADRDQVIIDRMIAAIYEEKMVRKNQ